MPRQHHTADVLVIGAGPTGLLLAGDLAEAGLRVTVLERRGPDIGNISRAFGVHARTMEVLDARGLADDLDALGVLKLDDLRLFERVKLDLTALPSRFPFLLITPQYHVEEVLLRRAVDAGAEFAYDTRLTGLDQDAEGVTVTAETGDGTAEYRASYVVGADGVRSAVRNAIGLAYPGKSVLRSIMLADVRLAETPAETLTVNGVGDGFTFIAPFGDGWYRVFAWDRRDQVDDDAPLELEEIAAVSRRALGTDFGMHSPRWMSRFHSDERQAPHYRVGRVFIAGDAAHSHSPAGGQGMNTGLQDAANLGWKLAAVLHGAPEALLDTYEAERHPVGREVLRSSGALIRAAMLKSRVGRYLRGVLLGAALRIGPIRRKALGTVTAIGVAYEAPRGAHRLVGKRAEDLDLGDGRRLYEALRGGHFVAVGAQPAGERDGVIAVDAEDAPARAMLVRPDGHIAWAADDGDSATLTQALDAALAELLGAR
jgi:2-polyprenyl-6-methoxyphenol hydroxylase-like FAD-dependent oxidoreductase